LQRLAPARGRAARAHRPHRGVSPEPRPPRAQLSRRLAPAAARSHLRAQRRDGPTVADAAPPLVAPVRPRPAGGRGPAQGGGMNTAATAMNSRWLPGNRIELLCCGEDYYPSVFQAIDT